MKGAMPLEEDDEEHEEGAIGRPKERTKYNTDKHVRDRDPIGKKARKNGRDADRTVKHKYKGSNPLSRTESKKSHVEAIKKQLPNKAKNIIKETFKNKNNKPEPSLLDEQRLENLD